MITHTLSANWQGQNGATVTASYSFSGNVETNVSEVLTANEGGQIVPFSWPNNSNAIELWVTTDQICWMAANQAAPYVFTCSSSTAAIGDTYTNNGQTFTVQATLTAGTTLLCSGTGAPTGSGTLTKSSGASGSSATIAFSAQSTAIFSVQLQSNRPYIWHNQNYSANPMSAAITELGFSTQSTTAPNLKIRSLHN